MLVGTSLDCHSLHKLALCLVCDRPCSKVTRDSSTDEVSVVAVKRRDRHSIACVDGESQNGFSICHMTVGSANHSCKLATFRNVFDSIFPKAFIQ